MGIAIRGHCTFQENEDIDVPECEPMMGSNSCRPVRGFVVWVGGGGYKIAATATECLTLGDSVAGALHLKVRLAGASSQPLRFESREGDIGESQRGGHSSFPAADPCG